MKNFKTIHFTVFSTKLQLLMIQLKDLKVSEIHYSFKSTFAFYFYMVLAKDNPDSFRLLFCHFRSLVIFQ